MGAVQLLQFGYKWQQAQDRQPVQLVLSTSPGGYLRNIPGSSDLGPVGGNFKAIRDRTRNIFTEPARDSDLPES